MPRQVMPDPRFARPRSHQDEHIRFLPIIGHHLDWIRSLEAGQVIDHHVDGAGYNLQSHKIYSPLITNPEAFFAVDDEPFHLQAGRAYKVKNIKPHAAVNSGSQDRTQLYFELYDESAGWNA